MPACSLDGLLVVVVVVVWRLAFYGFEFVFFSFWADRSFKFLVWLAMTAGSSFCVGGSESVVVIFCCFFFLCFPMNNLAKQFPKLSLHFDHFP